MLAVSINYHEQIVNRSLIFCADYFLQSASSVILSYLITDLIDSNPIKNLKIFIVLQNLLDPAQAQKSIDATEDLLKFTSTRAT